MSDITDDYRYYATGVEGNVPNPSFNEMTNDIDCWLDYVSNGSSQRDELYTEYMELGANTSLETFCERKYYAWLDIVNN